ncbi:MAG: XkdX family protein [Cetobacterium sp.]
MNWFEFIRDNYIEKFYTKEDVYEFVELGQIEEEEYLKIINS